MFKQLRPKSCEWDRDEDGIYLTSCGDRFYDASEVEEVTQWAAFCPYCGNKIEVKETKG